MSVRAERKSVSAFGRNVMNSTLPSKHKQRFLRFLSIKPVLDERPIVQEHLRRSSVVYPRSCSSSHPGPRSKLGQRQVTELRLKDWEKYGWSPLKSTSLPAYGSFTTREGREKRSFGPGYSREGDNRMTSSLSLPPLSRASSGQAMLRRPTRRMSLRTASAGDDVMDMLGNYLDLKPIQNLEGRGLNPDLLLATDDPEEAFYSEHFPLLLEKKSFHKEEEAEDSAKVVSHRQLSHRITSAQKRRAEVSRRCHVLERALTSLELEEDGIYPDDTAFMTELREDTFDPRQWPWNTDRYLQS